MATHTYNTSPEPMQPGLRSFIIYDHLPEGCTAFRLTDDHGEPHIRMGELAIIDPREREPAAGELALIQYKSLRPSEAHHHRFIVEMRPKKGGWIVSPVQADRLLAVAGEDAGPPQRMRWWDGTYSAADLSAKLLGRVIGILEPGFVEPMLIAGCQR